LIDIKKAWTFSKSVQFVPAILLISIFLVLRHFNIKNKKRLYKEKKEKEMMKTTPNGEDIKTK
jgi:regulatory protein YycI of two-component signal transduction system YycFG